MTDDSQLHQGQILYRVDYLGPQLPQAKFHWNSKFPTVTIDTPEDGSLRIEINCTTSHDPAKTRLDAYLIAERVTHELALRFSCSIGTPVEYFSNIPYYTDAHGTVKRRVSTSLRSGYGVSAGTRPAPTASDLQEVAAGARDMASSRRDTDLELYRSAIAPVDLVARFVPLYATLQRITNRHTQDDLDDWICATGPVNVALKPQKRRNEHRTTETDLTRVRNLLGHVRSQKSFNAVLREARGLVPSLQKLVVRAIDLKYGKKPL